MSTDISSCLLPLLRERFGDRPMRLSSGQNPVAVFPSGHPDVGDLVVHDEGDELTVFVGRFTHVHFSNYDEGITDSQRSQRIAKSLVDFLQDLFTDQIEMYGSHNGGGGTRHRALVRSTEARSGSTIHSRTRYVWSGPLPNDL